MKAALYLLVLGVLVPIAQASPSKVLYLYGDVAGDGTVPSGSQEPFHQMRLSDTGARGMSQFADAIRRAGFQLDEAYDAELVLDEALLSEVSVLILASNQRRFTADESFAVSEWVKSGGGLIAWSDSAFGGHFSVVGVDNETGRLSDNDIMVPFGMYFMTDNGAGNYRIIDYEEDHFLNAYEKNGGVQFRGEGVSPVRVSPPAIMLARLQEGGLGGEIRLNAVDGDLDPDRDAALAIAEHGEGRVVGVFDRNLFWNAGEGTRLSHDDNREFTLRMVTWAAGQESQWSSIERGLDQSDGLNQPPQIAAQATMLTALSAIDLIGEVIDEDSDGQDPEVSWKLQSGPAEIEFENNNPNGVKIRAFYTEPGEYVFLMVVSDGEHSLSRRVKVHAK